MDKPNDIKELPQDVFKRYITFNRDFKRRLAKGKVSEPELTLLMTSMYNATAQAIIRDTVRSYTSIILMELRDHYGWGEVRAKRLLESANSTFESVDKGFVSIDDLVECCETELNIQIL